MKSAGRGKEERKEGGGWRAGQERKEDLEAAGRGKKKAAFVSGGQWQRGVKKWGNEKRVLKEPRQKRYNAGRKATKLPWL